MGGKRLGSFRSGDRSEYLATYALSRFSFVNPFPRQEDFGVADFLCVLTIEEGRNVYPESAFYVQVKSTEDTIHFQTDAIRWISDHMDHPLFICVVDKRNNRVKLYSCWSLWWALFLRGKPDEIALVLNTPLPVTEPELHEDDDNTRFTVPLGPPIMSKSVEEIEEDPNSVYRVMRDWVRIDVKNIARRSLGRIAVTGIVSWQTNLAPSKDSDVRLKELYFYGPNYPIAERELAPLLTALAHNYRHFKEGEKLEAVCSLLEAWKPYLHAHGVRFADRTLCIE